MITVRQDFFLQRKVEHNSTEIIATVPLTSIYNPQIYGRFTKTSGGLTNLFYGCVDCLWSELVNATIKKVMAPLEVGLTFALI